MENNQQRNRQDDVSDNKTSTSSDKKDEKQVSSNSETANRNRFAETTSGEQHNESSKPDAENKTLGTP